MSVGLIVVAAVVVVAIFCCFACRYRCSHRDRAGQLPHPPREDQRHGEECYREQEREDVGHPRTVAGL
jgi:hypothetical protein